MNQIIRVGFKHVLGQIGTPHVRCEGRIRKRSMSPRRYVELISTPVTRRVTVASTCSNPLRVEQQRTSTVSGRALSSASRYRRLRYRTLINGRTPHVADVVDLIDVEPRIKRTDLQWAGTPPQPAGDVRATGSVPPLISSSNFVAPPDPRLPSAGQASAGTVGITPPLLYGRS